MIKNLSFFIIFLIFSTKVLPTNIAVVDINALIDNSKHFISISEQINNSQIEDKENFKIIEENLFKSKSELEDLRLILNEEEFNIKKNEYYTEVEKFQNLVGDYNKHYENQIINIKNTIFIKITELIQQYASKNKIDLILDKNQYLISADKININEIIYTQLNQLNIELKYEKYEN